MVDGPRMSFAEGIICPQASQMCCDTCLPSLQNVYPNEIEICSAVMENFQWSRRNDSVLTIAKINVEKVKDCDWHLYLVRQNALVPATVLLRNASTISNENMNITGNPEIGIRDSVSELFLLTPRPRFYSLK